MSNRKGVKWISQSVINTFIYMGLCVTNEQLQHTAKKYKFNDRVTFPPPDGATTWIVKNQNGDECNIVCINPADDNTPLEIQGLVLHEAVHVWQNILESIHEDDPGYEIEAYAIQQLYLNLMGNYEEMRRDNGKVSGNTHN